MGIELQPQPNEAMVSWACKSTELYLPADRVWWVVPAPRELLWSFRRKCACGRSVVLIRYESEDPDGQLYIGQCQKVGCQSIIWAYYTKPQDSPQP